MSRLSDLIREAKAKDPTLGAELEREYKAISSRRAFGLNFERHRPEAVELPQRAVRKGDKVRVLPPRGATHRGDQRLWRVTRIERTNDGRVCHLALLDDDAERSSAACEDVVVVAEFRDPIYPGLVSTGKVERGGDKPFHTVINAENFHALKALTFTHKGKVDAIYIDPPYNTGARDWKYNNDYVEGDDLYRHSKWLAFMERRLLLCRQLLNPADSVLIVTIDEKEYNRLGLLLEQVFPDARITMVASSVSAGGVSRAGTFGRSAEYLYFCQLGTSRPTPLALGSEWNAVNTANKEDIYWSRLIRAGTNALRSDRPNQFYPVLVRDGSEGPVFHSVGDPHQGEPGELAVPDGCAAVWPIRRDGQHGRWQVSSDALRDLIAEGHARIGKWNGESTTIYYLKRGERRKVREGVYVVTGHRPDGSVIADTSAYETTFLPTDIWRLTSHDAGNSGSRLLARLIPGVAFPFPKSLYAVEDALRFFLREKPDAIVLDFFVGSGTTPHAVMRLNREDLGRRQCISVTNNEVSSAEQDALLQAGLRPGEPGWEEHGICESVTKPRVRSAIEGMTSDGTPLKGDYRFNAEFPLADGLAENAEFFTLTYESPLRVSHNRAFERIAPLLWLRAGARGDRIDKVPEAGWSVVEAYGLLVDLDCAEEFCGGVADRPSVSVVFVVTDDDRRFQSVVRRLPESVEPVRLYESYLSNFRFVSGE